MIFINEELITHLRRDTLHVSHRSRGYRYIPEILKHTAHLSRISRKSDDGEISTRVNIIARVNDLHIEQISQLRSCRVKSPGIRTSVVVFVKEFLQVPLNRQLSQRIDTNLFVCYSYVYQGVIRGNYLSPSTLSSG